MKEFGCNNDDICAYHYSGVKLYMQYNISIYLLRINYLLRFNFNLYLCIFIDSKNNFYYLRFMVCVKII